MLNDLARLPRRARATGGAPGAGVGRRLPLARRGLRAGRRGRARGALRTSSPPAEVFHEILEHRWFLSEQLGDRRRARRGGRVVRRGRAPPRARRAHHPRAAGSRCRFLDVSAVADVVGGIATPHELERYADAVVLGSLYLRPGDTLFVQAEPSHREVAVALAEAAYRSGAALVDVHYADRRLTAARVRHAADEHLGPVTDWHRRKLREQLKPTSGVVTVLGEDDPGVFDGLPAERIAEDSYTRLKRVNWYVRAVMGGARRWVGMGWPTAFWASQVFPDLDPPAAQRKLFEELLWFCRLGPDDPPGYEGWTRHVDTLAARARALSRARARASRAARSRHGPHRPAHARHALARRPGGERAGLPARREHPDGGELHEPRSAGNGGHVPLLAAPRLPRADDRGHLGRVPPRSPRAARGRRRGRPGVPRRAHRRRPERRPARRGGARRLDLAHRPDRPRVREHAARRERRRAHRVRRRLRADAQAGSTPPEQGEPAPRRHDRDRRLRGDRLTRAARRCLSSATATGSSASPRPDRSARGSTV